MKIATGSPQKNGQADRVNRVMKPMLAKLVDSKDRKFWYKSLPLVEYTLNNVVHKFIRDAPSRILFGVNQRLKPVDEVWEYLESQLENDIFDLDAI